MLLAFVCNPDRMLGRRLPQAQAGFVPWAVPLHLLPDSNKLVQTRSIPTAICTPHSSTPYLWSVNLVTEVGAGDELGSNLMSAGFSTASDDGRRAISQATGHRWPSTSCDDNLR